MSPRPPPLLPRPGLPRLLRLGSRHHLAGLLTCRGSGPCLLHLSSPGGVSLGPVSGTLRHTQKLTPSPHHQGRQLLESRPSHPARLQEPPPPCPNPDFSNQHPEWPLKHNRSPPWLTTGSPRANQQSARLGELSQLHHLLAVDLVSSTVPLALLPPGFLLALLHTLCPRAFALAACSSWVSSFPPPGSLLRFLLLREPFAGPGGLTEPPPRSSLLSPCFALLHCPCHADITVHLLHWNGRSGGKDIRSCSSLYL